MNKSEIQRLTDSTDVSKPLIVLLGCFIGVPVICRVIFKMGLSDTVCIGLLACYEIITLLIAARYTSKNRSILLSFYPGEYAELCDLTLFSVIRTPLGNLHYMNHIDEVVTNHDKYDKELVELYIQMDDNGSAIRFFMFGGFIGLALLYFIFIVQ